MNHHQFKTTKTKLPGLDGSAAGKSMLCSSPNLVYGDPNHQGVAPAGREDKAIEMHVMPRFCQQRLVVVFNISGIGKCALFVTTLSSL
jgi:hypothetical protein